MNKSIYIYLSLFLAVFFSLVYFPSMVKKGVKSKPTQADTQPECEDIKLTTVSGGVMYNKNQTINLKINGTPLEYTSELMLKVMGDKNSENIYTIDTNYLIRDDSHNGSVNLEEFLVNLPPTDFDSFFLFYLNVYDTKGKLACSGDTVIQPKEPTHCPGCTKLITVGDSLGLTLGENTLGEVLQDATGEPTPTATPTPFEAFFRFDYPTNPDDPPHPDTYTFKTTDENIATIAREVLSGEREPLHVGGIIKFRAPDFGNDPLNYNKPWRTYLKEDNITFYGQGQPFCDARVKALEDEYQRLLDEGLPVSQTFCADFLPNCIWCPLGSRLLEEVEDPYGEACTAIDENNPSNPQDYSAWAFYFDPLGNPVEGGRSQGDMDCDGKTGPQDYSRWAFYYSPF